THQAVRRSHASELGTRVVRRPDDQSVHVATDRIHPPAAAAAADSAAGAERRLPAAGTGSAPANSAGAARRAGVRPAVVLSAVDLPAVTPRHVARTVQMNELFVQPVPPVWTGPGPWPPISPLP